MSYRILIADDSATVRGFLVRLLNGDPRFAVAGLALDGDMLMDMLRPDEVDAAVIDLEMPNTDGVEAIRRIRELAPALPVIVFTSHARSGRVIDAVAAGASGVVEKPSLIIPGEERDWAAKDLLQKLHRLIDQGQQLGRHTIALDLLLARRREGVATGVIAFAACAGSPAALEALVSELPKDLPVPVVVAQHMPPGFVPRLVERLDAAGPLPAIEARSGLRLEPGRVIVAPTRRNIRVVRLGGCDVVQLSAARSEHVPSADVLFESVADVYGPKSIAVALSGLGGDGVSGARAIRRARGTVIVQDEESASLWGVPGQIARNGLANDVLPLHRIGAHLARRFEDGELRRAV